jgi:timeless
VQNLKANAKRSSSKEPSSEDEEKRKAANQAFAAAVRGCGEIAATMDEEMFNMVVSRWREYADTIKEGKEFSALAAAGALLKDMVRETRSKRLIGSIPLVPEY